ncbi:hypothetical protein Bpfe_006782 [Biomphalaria pfeifferi]|uniref:Uncharacterized protein n=1 Tax=Biomphalaria pfeifferi TaxID=112525 RepID=A0AAD8BZL5_BIOPF|nr:hypothetical protein Bpfe_006782 [Biomphalaria pfeifferi]
MDNHNVSHENQDAASFQPTKWDMCAFCQKNTKEKLQCPANARQTNHVNVALSPGILTRLDDADGVEETFMKKKASFHMSCRLKYNTTKLKRKLASCDPGPSLSCDGRMRVSNKSGLLECLEPLQTSSAVPTVTGMTILDGAAVVNMLRPGSVTVIEVTA